MATIEERAYAAVGHPKPPKGSMITAEKLTWDEQIFRNGYIKGATEQKQIDIDKACTLIENVITDFAARYCEVWSEESRKSTFENIRNAMLED